MRLRKLGQGQSLVFVAPPEVDQNIRNITGKQGGDIDGYDVVAWSLEQSCQAIERSQPLRVLQGLGYHHRQKKMAAFTKVYPNFEVPVDEKNAENAVILAFREKEEQRLTDLYSSASLKSSPATSLINASQDDPHPIVQELFTIWQSVDLSISEGASMHEEHEREVAHEVEQEAQIQRPPRVKALSPAIDSALRTFIRTGTNVAFQAFPQAYGVVSQASANDVTAAELFIRLRTTSDFARTVETPLSGHYDSYLRPANWVLTSNKDAKPADLLLLSQYEVNQLFKDIHATSSKVTLHTYEPRVTKSMRAVDMSPPGHIYPSVTSWQNLTSSLRRELHLFAGQIYFSSYEEYRDCLDTIILPKPAAQAEDVLKFIKNWLAIRRKGQNFLPTHMGQVVTNRTIKEIAFD